MKIYIYIIFFFIFTFNLYSAGDSLIVYYPFDDENCLDYSGNHYDGNPINEPTYVPGISGKAIHLIGKGDYINKGQSISLIGSYVELPLIDYSKYNELTISLWVRFQGITTGGEAYYYAGYHTEWWLGIMNHINQYLYDYKLRIFFTAGGNEFDQVMQQFFDLQRDSNRWVNYVMTYNKSGKTKAYIDGVLIDSLQQTLQVSRNLSALGSHWWTYNGFERQSARFTGDIDEVKIFNKALSDEEVKKLANPCQDYFTLAFEDNKSLSFDSVTYATTNCKQISITNISDLPQNLEKVFLKYNIDFSIPQSQLPLVLLPHETKTIAVCFTPTKLGNIVDTLLIPNNCDSLLIPLSGIGSPNYYNAPSKCDVKLAGKTIDILNGGYLINSHLNYNINTENIDVSLVFNLNKSPNFPIQYSIYNYYGQAEMEGSQIVSSEIIGNNTIKANFNIPTNNLKNSLFLLVLKFQGNVLNYKFLKY